MKRIRLLVLLGAVAVAMPLGLATAKATGGHPPANSVEINYYAQYDFNGTIAHLGLNVRCKKGTLPANLGGQTGEVSGSISQGPPETAAPVVFNFGTNAVVCDGNTHPVGLSVQGVGLDAGKAKATVTLTPPVGGGSSVTSSRTVNIVVMNRP